MNATPQKNPVHHLVLADGVIFIRRRTVDMLLQRYPAFMAAVWPKLRRDWSISGVCVSGCAGSGLAQLVATVERDIRDAHGTGR